MEEEGRERRWNSRSRLHDDGSDLLQAGVGHVFTLSRKLPFAALEVLKLKQQHLERHTEREGAEFSQVRSPGGGATWLEEQRTEVPCTWLQLHPGSSQQPAAPGRSAAPSSS